MTEGTSLESGRAGGSTDEPLDDGASGAATDPLAGLRLDWLVTGCTLWGATGLVLDVRSHVEGFDFAEEGFLTPEHAVVYSGFLGVAFLLAVAVQRERWRGAGWRESVPPGYGLGVLGLVLFALAGPGDALWHATFGAEADLEALASPTHLALATGGVLFVTSPARATLRRAEAGATVAGWRAQGPLVLSATVALVVATVFTVFGHPGFVLAGASTELPAYGLLGLLFHAALLAGAVLSLSSRVPLARGAVALLVAAPATTAAFLGGNPWLAPWYLGAGGLAAVTAAGASRLDDPAGTRLLGAGVALAFATAHLAAVAVRGDLTWTVHLWAGAVFLAGVVGLLLATLASAPGAREAD